MKKHYLFFTRNTSQEPDSAHEIHDLVCANAAANLGYSVVFTYPCKKEKLVNPVRWLYPFQTRKADQQFIESYDIEDKLKLAPLPIPWPVDRIASKWLNSSKLVNKYYFPFHILHHTKIIHTRDWSFVKAAIKHQVPTIYERHYYQEKACEPEVVKSPFFQIAITQSEPIRQSLIEHGMPEEKVVWLHNGFEQSYLVRQPQEAEAWRQELLANGTKYLVVYSGALYRFKGIDVLIDAAKELPNIQFVLTGGTESQVKAYQQQAIEKQVNNVKFLGWILRKRLPSLFQAADVLAHPHCYGEAADFTNPVKFFQYMASGTPIAITEIPPLMQFKSSPMIALWCEADNPIAFTKIIEQILDKYPRKIEGYWESIDFARQFSWENRIAKILNYVNESMRPQIFD